MSNVQASFSSARGLVDDEGFWAFVDNAADRIWDYSEGRCVVTRNGEKSDINVADLNRHDLRDFAAEVFSSFLVKKNLRPEFHGSVELEDGALYFKGSGDGGQHVVEIKSVWTFVRDLKAFGANQTVKLWTDGERFVKTSYNKIAYVNETMAFESDSNGDVGPQGYADIGLVRDRESHAECVRKVL
jgi:hypothetical protein